MSEVRHFHRSPVGIIGPILFYCDEERQCHYHVTPTGMSSVEVDTPDHKHTVPGEEGWSMTKEEDPSSSLM